MQLLCEHSEENDTPCLGVIPQRVIRFKTESLKVPKIGWNTLSVKKIVESRYNREEIPNAFGKGSSDSILSPDLDGAWFYFVHSYYVEKGAFTTATADYGGDFSACLRKDNFHAAQFHPEKSSVAGERLLQNFLEIKN